MQRGDHIWSNAKGGPQGTLGLAKGGPQEIFQKFKIIQKLPQISENCRKPSLSSKQLVSIDENMF
jgi:hypothetical protein